MDCCLLISQPWKVSGMMLSMFNQSLTLVWCSYLVLFAGDVCFFLLSSCIGAGIMIKPHMQCIMLIQFCSFPFRNANEYTPSSSYSSFFYLLWNIIMIYNCPELQLGFFFGLLYWEINAFTPLRVHASIQLCKFVLVSSFGSQFSVWILF